MEHPLSGDVDDLGSDGEELFSDFAFEALEAGLAQAIQYRQGSTVGHVAVDHLQVLHRHQQGIFALILHHDKLPGGPQDFAFFDSFEDPHPVGLVDHVFTRTHLVQHQAGALDAAPFDRLVEGEDQLLGAQKVEDPLLIDEVEPLQIDQLTPPHQGFAAGDDGDAFVPVGFDEFVGVGHFQIPPLSGLGQSDSGIALPGDQGLVEAVEFVQIFAQILGGHAAKFAE